MNNGFIDTLHPVHSVYDGKANTYTKKVYSIINPTPDQICLTDIAKGLSNICRFGGQIENFYSVARHTLLVWWLVPGKYKKVALLHDSPEAFLGDVIKPLKILLESIYGPIEDNFARIICEKYHVDPTLIEEIKIWDKQALEIEHCYFQYGDDRLTKAFKEINRLIGPPGMAYKQLLALLYKEFGQYE